MTNGPFPAWSTLLWGMALLGLLLLPSDYRAGAEWTHGHALAQLWIDASDGTIRHHHHTPANTQDRLDAGSWFDPALNVAGNDESTSRAVADPDIGHQHDSSPVSGSAQFLIAIVTAVLIAPATLAPFPAPGQRLASRWPRVLLRPPRRASAAA